MATMKYGDALKDVLANREVIETEYGEFPSNFMSDAGQVIFGDERLGGLLKASDAWKLTDPSFMKEENLIGAVGMGGGSVRMFYKDGSRTDLLPGMFETGALGREIKGDVTTLFYDDKEPFSYDSGRSSNFFSKAGHEAGQAIGDSMEPLAKAGSIALRIAVAYYAPYMAMAFNATEAAAGGQSVEKILTNAAITFATQYVKAFLPDLGATTELGKTVQNAAYSAAINAGTQALKTGEIDPKSLALSMAVPLANGLSGAMGELGFDKDVFLESIKEGGEGAMFDWGDGSDLDLGGYDGDYSIDFGDTDDPFSLVSWDTDKGVEGNLDSLDLNVPAFTVDDMKALGRSPGEMAMYGFSVSEIATSIGKSETFVKAELEKDGVKIDSSGVYKESGGFWSELTKLGSTAVDKFMKMPLGDQLKFITMGIAGVSAAAKLFDNGDTTVSQTTNTIPKGVGDNEIPEPIVDIKTSPTGTGLTNPDGTMKTAKDMSFEDFVNDFYGLTGNKTVQQRIAEDQSALGGYQNDLLTALGGADTARFDATKAALAPYQKQLGDINEQLSSGKGLGEKVSFGFDGKPMANFIPKVNRNTAAQLLDIGRTSSSIGTGLADLDWKGKTDLAGRQYGFQAENLPNKAADSYTAKLMELMKYFNPGGGQASTTTGTVPDKSWAEKALEGASSVANIWDKIYNPRQTTVDLTKLL